MNPLEKIIVSALKHGKGLTGEVRTSAKQLEHVTDSIHEISARERELEQLMVPKLVELATKGEQHLPRFNEIQINSISKSMEDYITSLSKTDLTKEILAIGENNGLQLSAEEIDRILRMTSGMKPEQQKNVLSYVRHYNEVLHHPPKTTYTRQDIEKMMPYEDFRAGVIEENKISKQYKTMSELEEDTKRIYENKINFELSLYNDPLHRKVFQDAVEGYSPVGLINEQHAPLVKAIANCEDPNTFAEVVRMVGESPATVHSPDSITKIYKMLHPNSKKLLKVIDNSFSPEEIREIANILEGTTRKTPIKPYPQDLSRITRFYDSSINDRRREVLRTLGIEDKMQLKPITYKHVEQPKFVDGDYGRGKRRK